MADISPLRYKQLLDHQSAIRLVRLEDVTGEGLFSLKTRDAILDDGPTYTALSYVWGSDAPSYRITVNDQAFWIRQNLWSFFVTHYDKLRQGIWLWINNICIDQHSVAEKNRQVPLMGQIYSKAEKVVSWLNDPAPPALLPQDMTPDASSLLVSVIKSLSSWASVTEGTNGIIHAHLLAGALARLLGNDYWTRAWVVQELQLAKAVELHWGRHVFRSQDLIESVSSLVKACMALGTVQHLDLENLQSRMQTLVKFNHEKVTTEDTRATLGGSAVASETRPFLIDLILRMRGLSCSIIHDRAYAFLSLARDSIEFLPDYDEPIAELIARITHNQKLIPSQIEVENLAETFEVDLKRFPFKVVAKWQTYSFERPSAKPAWSDPSAFTFCKWCCPLSWSWAVRQPRE